MTGRPAAVKAAEAASVQFIREAVTLHVGDVV